MAIEPDEIDTAAPWEGNPTTASVRANFAAIKACIVGLMEQAAGFFSKAGGDIEGSVNLSGAGREITADMSSNPGRLVLRNNVENAPSVLTIAPAGTGNGAQVNCHGGADWRNSTLSRSGVVGTEIYHTGNKTGTGGEPTLYRWGPSLSTNATMDNSGETILPGALRLSGVYQEINRAAADQDALLNVRNAVGQLRVMNAAGGTRGLTLTGPEGQWQGWLIYAASGETVARIGTLTPSAASFNEAADAAFVRAIHASDRKLKSEIETVGSVLAGLRRIAAKTYKMKGYKGRRLGSIAQDWQEVWPEAVTEIKYDGEDALGIDPLAAVAILAQGINELQDRLERLERAQQGGDASADAPDQPGQEEKSSEEKQGKS
jgi:hypothetical protein